MNFKITLTVLFSFIGLLILMLLVLDTTLYKLPGIYLKQTLSDEAQYVGSDVCGRCHQEQYSAWQGSLHSKIYKPKEEATIHADFSNPEEIGFTLDDVDWVIGSRWKQEFVQMRDGKGYVFPAIWLVKAKKWEIKKNKQERITGELCDGCHTTGFELTTQQFAEDSIGCEACHGPGGQHTISQKSEDIFSSPQVEVCSQCHTRGISSNRKTPFPVNYKLGEPMEKYFVTRKTWDGKIPIKHRQHHDEFTSSKHYKALDTLQKGKKEPKVPHADQPVEEGCLRCHSNKGKHNRGLLAVDDAKHGLTCVTCHNPHKSLYSKGETARVATICGSCHVNSLRKYGPKQESHFPCPESAVSCPDCHMPKIKYVAEKFDMRDHSFKIITPDIADQNKIPSSCSAGKCHDDLTSNQIIEKYDYWYGDK